MQQTVYRNDFHRAFELADRGGNFSTEALDLLFDYLKELEEDMDEPYEFDVIAICCKYSEDHTAPIVDAYNIEFTHDIDSLEADDVVREYLQDKGVLIGETPTSFVYLQF